MIAVDAVLNVIFLLQSRTSYVIVISLLLCGLWRFIIQRRPTWRTVSVGLLAIVVLVGAAVLAPHTSQRLMQIESDLML